MSIKKLLLSALLLTTTGFTYAQEATTDDYIEVESCTLVAGDIYSTDVNINLHNVDKDWCALQFDLQLPPNVFLDDFEEPVLSPTNRCQYYFEEEKVNPRTGAIQIVKHQGPFTLAWNDLGNGVYRFVAYNQENGPFSDDGENEAIFSIKLYALDIADTRVHTATIKNAMLSKTSNSSNVTGDRCEVQNTDFDIQIVANIGTGGYGTFSWPTAVDFTNIEGVDDVYVVKGVPENGWLRLTPIGTQVPKETPVIIKGDVGEIHPTTIDDIASIDDNKLEGTWADLMGKKVDSDNIFAIATKGEKTAFYPVSTGVVIPQYKAYMINESNAKFLSFGDTATSIDALDMAEEDGDIYTLGGQKVQKTTMKGVYIKNGKKVVVK